MYCKNCGKKLNLGDEFCTNCGAKIENEINIINENVSQQTSVLQQEEKNQTYFHSDNSKKFKWKSNASLVIGIIVFLLMPYLEIFIIPLCIIGIIFGIIGIKENKKNKIGLIINVIFLVLLIPRLSLRLESYDLANEFREHLTTNYNLDLAEKHNVGYKYYKGEFVHWGYYPLADDLTYAIKISKNKDGFDVTYDTQAIKMRKELYEYISTQKGNNYVENYLIFYDNGHFRNEYSFSEKLAYIVYYDDSVELDKHIYSDYQILQKASNILKSNSKRFIGHMEVFYIKDTRLKDENWLEQLNIEVEDYIFAPSYLDDDNELATEKYTYYYSVNDFDNYGDIGNWTFVQFKEKVYENLETK